MFGGIDPKKMQAMMRQMGIKQEEIEVERVILQCIDKNIVIQPANVQKITMQGQDSWQVTGQATEQTKEQGASDTDIALVAEKAGVSKAQAKEALKQSGGDIAQAILSLSK